MHARFAILPLFLLLLAASGCVGDARPSGCEADAVTVEVELSQDELVGDDPSVCRDQQVTMLVTADTTGTFHIHGYDHAVSAARYTPDKALELTFTADQAGQFTIEVHADDDPEGVPIGIFTVHER